MNKLAPDLGKEAPAPLPWWGGWFETEEEMLEFYSGYFPSQEETLTNLTVILRGQDDPKESHDGLH